MATGYTEAVRRADRLQTLDSAAAVLQLAPSTLRRWARQGRIRGHALDTAPWGDVLDFTTAPITYFRVREVLADASQ
jgi:hypothetical protein